MIRRRACNESDHVSGWDDPAKIRFAPVSPDNRPSAVDMEFPVRQIALPIPKAAHPIFGVRRSRRSDAKPTPQVGCQSAANENSEPILRTKLFQQCLLSGSAARVPANE